MDSCKNCAAMLQGPYCSQCGQKALTGRITLKYLGRSFLQALTEIDRGFWYTIQRLMTAPGRVAAEYLSGRRQAYFHPVRYLVLMITVSTVINLYSGVYDQQQSEMMNLQYNAMGQELTEDALAKQAAIQNEVKKYLNLLVLLMLPFLSLVSFWFFRKRSYNYAEHLTFNAFWTAQTALLGLPLFLLYYFFPKGIPYAAPIGMLISTFYYSFGYRQLFRISYGQAFFKGLMVNILGFVLMFVAIMVLTVLVVYLYLLIFK